jgi:short subunit fatty acids transporter
VATAYAGFLVWHGGLSGSIPLKIAGNDEILSKIGGWNFKFEGMVPDVKEYFNEEFMIENF